MLTIRGLRKSYGTVEVLKGVDLNLEAGRSMGSSERTARARPRS